MWHCCISYTFIYTFVSDGRNLTYLTLHSWNKISRYFTHHYHVIKNRRICPSRTMVSLSGVTQAFCFSMYKPLVIWKWSQAYFMFPEKVNHLYTNQPNFGPSCKQKSPDFSKNVLNCEHILAQIWENFEASTHSYTKFCIL